MHLILSSSTTPPVKHEVTVEDWVTTEVLNSECHFATDCSNVHTDVGIHVGKDLAEKDWFVSMSHIDERVCSTYPSNQISKYEIVFRKMRFQVSFTDFQISVFNHLELAPS